MSNDLSPLEARGDRAFGQADRPWPAVAQETTLPRGLAPSRLRGLSAVGWFPRTVGLLLVCLAGLAQASEPNDVLNDWLQAQANLKTWSAEFTQTRTLKALQEPLRTSGRLWFAAPDRFRWELGTPAQTIALRNADEMLVVYPRLKRAERYPLSGEASEAWRGALALLDAGFAADRAELEARFRIVSQTVSEERLDLVLEPLSATAKRFMTEVRLAVDRRTLGLVANEMRFADGSSLRNDFTNRVANPTLSDALFRYDLPEDFKVAEPASP